MSRKHLNLIDRCVIENGLVLEQSFREIAASLDCSPSTVMREVRNNRIFVTSSKTICENSYGCVKRKICGSSVCFNPCKKCHNGYDCREICKNFKPFHAASSTAHRMFVTPLKTEISVKRITRFIPRIAQMR